MTTWAALVRVLLGTSLTRARLAALAGLGLVAMVVGFAIGRADPTSPTEAAANLVNLYGLSLLAPIVTLVLASATLGDMVEDNTLMYLWLRPVRRVSIAFAAFTAAVLAAAPVVVIPLMVAALLAGGGPEVALGAAVSATLAVVGYAGVFVTAGILAKRALAWGIVYILIWEGFIARAGTSSSRLSIQYYARSVLADLADVSFRLGDASAVAAFVVPLAVAATGVLLTSIRLQRMSVA